MDIIILLPPALYGNELISVAQAKIVLNQRDTAASKNIGWHAALHFPPLPGLNRVSPVVGHAEYIHI